MSASTETERAVSGLEGKYLTFALDTEEYGLEILKVREIIGHMQITSVPSAPHYVRGVINLRGQVIPVIDMRLKFGMPEVDVTDQTCIIVVEIASHKNKAWTGIVVDHVSEVLDITDDQIEGPPQFGAEVDTGYILGLGKIGSQVKILLDIDKVLGGDEMARLTEQVA